MSLNPLNQRRLLSSVALAIGIAALTLSSCSTTDATKPANPQANQSSQPRSPATSASADPASPQSSSQSSPNLPSANESSDLTCNSPQTQTAMNLCSHHEYKATDAALNEAYQNLKAQQSNSGKQALEAAELAWIDYRDLDCTFAASEYEGGSIVPLVIGTCLEDQTKTRLTELQQPELSQLSYSEADAQLNQVYQSFMSAIKEARKDGLTKAQTAWIKYRDRNCAFESRYASVEITANQCSARMSETRAAQLQMDLQ